MEIDTYEYEAGQNRGERKEEKAEEEERRSKYNTVWLVDCIQKCWSSKLPYQGNYKPF